MTAWLHALDVWAYQFIAALWGMFWPTFLIVAAFTGVERLFPLDPKLPWRAVRFNLVWQLMVLSITLALSWTAWGHLIGWLAGVAGPPPNLCCQSWLALGRGWAHRSGACRL